MGRIWLGMALAGSLAAAGCGGGGEGNKDRQIRIANEYETRLMGLNDTDRGLYLRRAVMESGSRCKKPDASAYQQAYKNMSMWAVRCSDTGEWALFIAPTGDVQVRKCAHMKQLQLPECRLGEAAPPS